MKVRVLAKDIKKGEEYSETSCPIALALKRKTHKHCEVNTDHIYIDTKRYIMPDEAMDFVEHFDSGCTVRPFSFETYPEAY